MGLPRLDRAVIAPVKVRDYLLNPEHPVGRAKARFFNELGFDRAHWADLHAALLSHAALGDVQVLPLGRFGQKSVVRGSIRGPTGATAPLLAVWIEADPAVGPRFVTAYPEEL
jgi:ABC-type sulfate transport system permease subunit